VVAVGYRDGQRSVRARRHRKRTRSVGAGCGAFVSARTVFPQGRILLQWVRAARNCPASEAKVVGWRGAVAAQPRLLLLLMIVPPAWTPPPKPHCGAHCGKRLPQTTTVWSRIARPLWKRSIISWFWGRRDAWGSGHARGIDGAVWRVSPLICAVHSARQQGEEPDIGLGGRRICCK